MLPPISPLLKRFANFTGAALLGVVLMLPWWRNHALLRDFYDYGLVMAAAGRINLGERPYVDFATPIQTLHLQAAALTERIMGESYLSLTYANGLVISASFVLLAALLARRLGGWTALLISGAVVGASSGQHTIVWHNAMGVALLAVVVWTAARLPWEGRVRWLAWATLLVALWLGGMTKVTYQIAALAFVVLFLVRAAWLGKISRRAAGLGLGSVVLAGIILPVATEMGSTGATFAEWTHNVLQLARARAGLLEPISSPGFYLHTPHDYYSPMYLPFVGAWGVVLVLAVVAIVGRSRPFKRDGFWITVAATGAIASAAVLLATNFDIGYLSGAAWLVLAVGLGLAFGEREDRLRHRRLQLLLGLASVSLLVPAWVSAWIGARTLWGAGSRDRAELVSADTLPKRFEYLRGLAIPAGLHASLQGFDDYSRSLAAAGASPSAFYFVNATEWMVRAFPEARHRGLPLWLHQGTTFSEEDVWLITDRLDRGAEIQVVVSDDRWNVWFFGMDAVLKANYRADRVGPQLHIYRRRPVVHPVTESPIRFAQLLGSNLLVNEMTVTGPKLEYRFRPDGGFVGATRSHTIGYGAPVRDVAGEMVAELLPEGIGREHEVHFRVIERRAGRADRVRAEATVVLSRKGRAAVIPFGIEALDGELVFDVTLPAEGTVFAGWRKLGTRRSADTESARPWPLDRGLAKRVTGDEWGRGLLAEGQLPPKELIGFGIDIHSETTPAGPELFTHVPGEVWLKLEETAARVSGEFGLRESAWTNANSLLGVQLSVVHYKGGRFEILDQRDLYPRQTADRVRQSFDVTLPETGGCLGLIITSLDDGSNAFGHVWWRNLRVR